MKSIFIEDTSRYSLQEKRDENSYYVINISGANLYKKPSLDSEIIENIKVGEKIVANRILKTEQPIHIGVEFQLQGGFIEVKNQVYSGFIHSSDLTRFKPQLEEILDGIIIPDFKGKVKSKTSEKKIETFNNKEYEVEVEITTYENVIHTYTDLNECLENTYLYKDMTLNEVYHQLPVHNPNIDITSKGSVILMPEFIEKKRSKYFFSGIGITRYTTIVENLDGQYLISSLDCP
ncbi:hypothetical protein LX95_00775 [Mesonia algae]|uniref:Uncharacterized protein n=1 Tax=Mesonia algae TaxID=213248 RepID=A0A2W7IUV5_9FLAO|nr:hypothetical protein [Mesonia algae]PZW42463.1 hypothetical protein LX95_00775 [Mesonia algae]